MSKAFIKLNTNDEHLSLGNLFRIIKELAKNKSAAMQTELFCTMFEIRDINDTTVNNYCVGARNIGSDYKQIFINKNKKYQQNHNIFCNTILDLISVIDGVIYHDKENGIDFINNNANAYYLSKKLYNIAKNDKQVSRELIDIIKDYLNNKKIYEALVEELLFIVLEKKQPIYDSDSKKEVLEDILNDTSISAASLQEYLSLKLREGINYDYSLKLLADSNNAYACYEIGCNEFYGYVKGTPRYSEALKYYLIAADLNHAGSCYMVARIYIDGLVGLKTKQELEKGYNYLNKAIELDNVAALNKLGTMYLEGVYPLKKNLKKALECFKKASEANYVYAFNNLGKIEENNNNLDKAMEYYKKSADLGESWACNKYAEYLRCEKQEIEKAYDYYNKATLVNYHNVYYYAYYNIAKYYLLNGNNLVPKNQNKALEYLEIASNNNVLEASIELLKYYISLYKKNKYENTYNKIITIKRTIECHDKYNNAICEEIEFMLNNIFNIKSINLDMII